MAEKTDREKRIERLEKQLAEYRELEEQAKAQVYSYRGAAQAIERELSEERENGEQVDTD
jgi:DNA polymerase/3'-5' exonuclease PolX